MFRGTTPTHVFELPMDMSMVKRLQIIYAQNDKKLFTKELSDCTVEGPVVSVTLNQEETFKFDCRHAVQIQLRTLDMAGHALCSDVMPVSVEKCLSEEVLS